MPIWFDKELSVEKLKLPGSCTMGEFLGIEWTEVGENFIKAKMPVDQRTKQHYGLLHGGASCTLAETIGSVASAMVIDHSKFYCVGAGDKCQPCSKCKRRICNRSCYTASSGKHHSCMGYKNL